VKGSELDTGAMQIVELVPLAMPPPTVPKQAHGAQLPGLVPPSPARGCHLQQLTPRFLTAVLLPLLASDALPNALMALLALPALSALQLAGGHQWLAAAQCHLVSFTSSGGLLE
jgi:hypothetical protein